MQPIPTSVESHHHVVGLVELARRGRGEFSSEIISYIASFAHIVLRGAGKFGSSFGDFLLHAGVSKERIRYWDIRAGQIDQVNGLVVHQPFSEDLPARQTLIINCIPNGSLSGSAGAGELVEYGYFNHLSGMALFEALMCTLKAGAEFDRQICIRTTFCNWCACERLPSLLLESCNSTNKSPRQTPLVLPVATFAINQKCTLKCTHCGQYINHYTADAKINFPVERIVKDIDQIFAAVDAIGYVSIIGGEPFLHPQLEEIVAHVLTKKNFGVLGITTNGVCDMPDEMLSRFAKLPIRLIFSDYTGALSEPQKRLFSRNLDRVVQLGVNHTIGQPLWSTPASLKHFDLSEDMRRSMKGNCHSTVTCKTIQNGVYYPCSTTAGVGSHQLADYPEDWARIDEYKSADELRARIIEIDSRSSYSSCSHCQEGGQLLSQSGEQGIGERYIHIYPRC